MKVLGAVLLVVSMFVVSPAPAADAGTCYTSDCDYTRLTVAVREPHAGHRAVIRVRVMRLGSAPGPTGRVVVRLINKRGKQDTFRRAYDGAPVRIHTRRLAAGRYVVKTVFRPAPDSLAHTVSNLHRLRVRR